MNLKNVAVVVAQLAEWSLPTSEIRGSNPDIGEILCTKMYNRKHESKSKEAGNGPSKKECCCLKHLHLIYQSINCVSDS